MKRHWLIKPIVLVLALALITSASCQTGEVESTKIKVVVSIYPLADFVNNVGRDKVEVITLLPAGASPHTYEPTPSQLKDIAEAKLFVENGAGLEFWAEKVVTAAANPELVIVDTSKGIELLAGDELTEVGNPHIWLDPVLAQKQVRDIRDALIGVAPENEDFYQENTESYLERLDSLDKEIKQEVNLFTTKGFVCFHPAWAYFAQRYGLNQIAAIEESPGKEPTPEYIRRIIDQVRELGIKAIFAEPQFNPKAAQTIAAETGAEVIFLDPLGGPGIEGRDTYLELMHYNLEQMAKAMK
jgi:zinc transport system substrate-binding protein